MNILDYLKWRGDLTLKNSPFNEVDNLIISFMCYCRIDKYFKKKESYTVKQLSDLFFKDHSLKQINEDQSFISKTPLLLKAMAESERFKDCLIHDFVSTTNKDPQKQFCAFQMDLSDKTTFIVFRGTDDTLEGWKDSLNFSYKQTDSQTLALDYMKKHTNKFRKYRVGGHSKGGTLAIYATLLTPSIHSKVINVYSNDGPGLNHDILPKNFDKLNNRVKDKYIKIIPEFDFFGAIFSSNREKYVVKSDGFAIMQHDPLSWQVEGTHFVKGELSKNTLIIRKAFTDFLNTVTPEQCDIFINELYNACKQANINNIKNFTIDMVPLIINALRKLASSDPTCKKVALKLIEAFAENYKDQLVIQKDEVINELGNKISKIKKRIKKAIE